MHLDVTTLSATELDLQREVRTFLCERLPPGSYRLNLGMGAASDPDFSRDLGRRGWLGMTLPAQYGGSERSAVERLVVTEELLARGAPVGFHWIADRQSGPSILAHGTKDQKQRYLPGIARGELSFAIGMSEPDSGSDLASLRSTARPDGDHWRLDGTKVWTTGAHFATHLLALFRTSPDRHGGLTQFIVDAETPGVTISPITFIDDTSDFCEVSFNDVRVADHDRLGGVGAGWGQNTGELALERGGVDRWMSMMPVLDLWATQLVRDRDRGDDRESAAADLAALTARCWTLHQLSLAVARMVDKGQTPVVEAALVKEMATRFEQRCVDVLARHYTGPLDPESDDQLDALLARALLVSPAWTIRGGTTEILRSVIAKGMRRS